jgi:pyruvate,water dikinase
MNSYVLGFNEIDKTKLMLVGGKGLNLGELFRLNGVHVPDGFCITTEAYKKVFADNEQFNTLMNQLLLLKVEEREKIIETSRKMRAFIERVELPKDIEEEIVNYLSKLGEKNTYAIRSSATAEDLPNASFAGQQETYLNIKGKDEVLKNIIKCWASLFTERAITYRIQNGFDHRKVFPAVVIQRMVLSEASGTMFTADPMTSDRKTLSIEASFGLGEAIVSGLTAPDIYKIKNGKIVSKTIGAKELEIRPIEGGGTKLVKAGSDKNRNQALSDEQILLLAAIGKRIETHFGCPQDIEWCYSEGQFQIVQSRPITTLFPIPEASDSKKPRVFISVGHAQMMTDAIKPLGISFLKPFVQFPLVIAGGRAFIDITHDLSSSIGRKMTLLIIGKQDPLMCNSLEKLMQNKAFIASLPRGRRNLKGGLGILNFSSIKEALKIYIRNDTSALEKILTDIDKEINELERQISNLSGEKLFQFIEEDRARLISMAFDPRIMGAVLAAWFANEYINKNVEKWLGEKNVSDHLTKSIEHNITTEMGLALCDVADVVRNYPEVLNFFSQELKDEKFYDELLKLKGGKETYKTLKAFLDKYGMRCPGEIDITKDRWVEKPTQLIPILMNNIKVLKPGEHITRFQKGMLEAKEKEEEIIVRLKGIQGGIKKANKIRKHISILRNFTGFREYPKYYILRRLLAYKKAIMKEADLLVTKGLIKSREDIFYLYLDELHRIVKTNQLDYSMIEKRKADYLNYEKLIPPRVITSEGFVPPTTDFTKAISQKSFSGTPVSGGVAEGRARVVLSVKEANIEAGDILVTQFTDPSWTTLFVTIKGLVTEVGGFTTHGAVIAREYGIPAVVGVENATKLIKDGQRIRVNGTEGYVEIIG